MSWLARARYAGGNVIRAAATPWTQFTIAPSEASTIFGCSFGDGGWQHIRRTLGEYDANPSIAVDATTMHQYLTRFTPSSIADLVAWRRGSPCRLPLFVYPWGTFIRGETTTSRDPMRSRFCGPSAPEFIRDEFDRTIRLYQRMTREGYRPWQYPNHFVGGTMLMRADGARRFVVLQGNHRCAMLAHLGERSIAVRGVRGRLRVIRESDARQWPHVASGACSEGSALDIFHYFFEADGTAIAAAIMNKDRPQ